MRQVLGRRSHDRADEPRPDVLGRSRGALRRPVDDLDEARAGRVLDARCADRPDLRAEVESLLAADAQAAALDRDRVAARARRAAGLAARRRERWSARFVSSKPIGAGGMGTVYRAERSRRTTSRSRSRSRSSPRRSSHAAAARRFRAERQILASLRHPHIVTLLDGGVTPTATRYLVMEYVDGVPDRPSTAASDALPLADRLASLPPVCSAVHYAHRHAVVHRDLKPANILVTADGVPKVLDFGVAKLLDCVGGDRRRRRPVVGPGPLTPNYASPEQLRGLAVTTSSDVYALGVLLYELVAGRRPYETEGKPLDEVMRLVVEADPPRPSTARSARRLPYEPRAR